MTSTRAARSEQTVDAILAVVADLLEAEGYDAVRLRRVAKQARVSLATIYKLFPTRDELIVATLLRWMEANAYAGIGDLAPDASLYDGIMWSLRRVFEPWERSPRMLEAYHRARTGHGGDRLDVQGLAAVMPVVRAVLKPVDPAYARDLDTILRHMAYAVVGRFADGDLAITEIMPVLQRAVFRLTANAPMRDDWARSTAPAARPPPGAG